MLFILRDHRTLAPVSPSFPLSLSLFPTFFLLLPSNFLLRFHLLPLLLKTSYCAQPDQRDIQPFPAPEVREGDEEVGYWDVPVEGEDDGCEGFEEGGDGVGEHFFGGGGFWVCRWVCGCLCVCVVEVAIGGLVWFGVVLGLGISLVMVGVYVCVGWCGCVLVYV